MDDTYLRLGNNQVQEGRLLEQLGALRQAIQTWAQRRRLWHDAGFHIPFLHNDESPRKGDVLYLWYEGPLYQVFNGSGYKHSDRYREEFEALLTARGFEFDLENHITATIYPSDERARDDYFLLYRWQWLQHLAERRLLDIHHEVFAHIAKQPDALRRLSWRQYEEFLDAIFRNQGFQTALGPGTNDGGVDIRLYQSSSIPELVTLVQAKRYTKRPIGLEAVAALLGIAAPLNFPWSARLS